MGQRKPSRFLCLSRWGGQNLPISDDARCLSRWGRQNVPKSVNLPLWWSRWGLYLEERSLVKGAPQTNCRNFSFDLKYKRNKLVRRCFNLSQRKYLVIDFIIALNIRISKSCWKKMLEYYLSASHSKINWWMVTFQNTHVYNSNVVCYSCFDWTKAKFQEN